MKLPAGEVVSAWLPVTEQRIRDFAEATDDRQWIHVDRERAERESPYGGLVAHGFLTLSLIPRLMPQVEDAGMVVNYGLNRVRFIAPVPAGSNIRGRFRVAAAEQEGRGTKVTWDVTIECDAAAKPCCVAECVTLYLEEVPA